VKKVVKTKLKYVIPTFFSPTQGFARVQIDRRAMRNLLFFGHLLDRQGDREGDANGDLRLSCTLHLPALQLANRGSLK
jgi:hypothetical protein